MKNIVFDVGNTYTKYAVFADGSFIDFAVVENITEKICLELIKKYKPLDGVIFSVVGEISSKLISHIKEYCSIVLMGDYLLPVPVENLYESKETLGFDRIAACIGANYLYPNKDVLVIDAGTAITYDIINRNAQYLGGLISPGLDMRFRALSEFTAKLPLCSRKEESIFIGKKTDEAIIGGVQNGIVNEIDGYISAVKEEFHEIEVILTGGDAIFFDKRLKNSIFVQSKILLYGLNRILEYNAEK